MNKPNKNNSLTTKRIEKSHKIVENVLQKYVDDANKLWNEMEMPQYMSEKWDKHGIMAHFNHSNGKIGFDGELCSALMGMAESSLFADLLIKIENGLNKNGFDYEYEGMGVIQIIKS